MFSRGYLRPAGVWIGNGALAIGHRHMRQRCRVEPRIDRHDAVLVQEERAEGMRLVGGLQLGGVVRDRATDLVE
jgi:hypothetical protein